VETSNIRIITSLGDLAYKSAADLGIQLSRIVDDFQDPGNRFQDFSYDFELPYIKQNSLVFGAPESLGSKNYFPINQSIPCQVYLNNQQLLDGLINLELLTPTGYKCKFYSKFKELIDELNKPNADGSDKTLRNLKFPVITGWSYEDSIVQHMAIYGLTGTSDQTFYQFPLCKYSTFYTEANLYGGVSGQTMWENETRRPVSYPMRVDSAPQNFYILINSNLTNNTSYTGISTTGHSYYQRIYIHQVPPAIYLVSIVKQILSDAGWQLGGQFFNNKDLKRIIYTYAGDEDIYDQATEQISGSTDVNLQIAKFLPEDNQGDFLKNVCNMFNLYIKVDVANKICTFETYNVLFGDNYDPYDITQKIDKKTMEFSYNLKNNPSIKFEKANNQNIMGDNYVMVGQNNNATTQVWTKASKANYNSFMNKIGTDDKIDIGFSEPNICRQFIYNDVTQDGPWTYEHFSTMYLPCLTKQSPTDNDSKKFNKATGDTYLFNTEDTIKFAGKGSMMFYYGRPIGQWEQKTGKGNLSRYMYYNMFTATGTTLNKVIIPVVSPMQLFNYRVNVDQWLAQVHPNYITGTSFFQSNVEDRRTTIATYLQALWQLMGQSNNIANSITTDFSLVFDDSGYFHETLWTKFHKLKYDRYKYSEMLTATMRMNAYDWQEMQIERPIMYNSEIYNIVSIEGYDPIMKTCTIKLIKKL
jgi:hypothetical protein